MKTKNALLTTCLSLFMLVAYSQKDKIKGSKNVTVHETDIDAFNRIVVGEKFKIDLIEGSEASVYIEADDNLHDVIQFEVVDSSLVFSTNMRITTSRKMSIKVTYTNALRQIETIENGQVSSLTSLNIDDIVLVHTGNSKAFLNVKSSKFKLINSEKSKVKLNLTTNLATLELNEGSKTEALITADSLQVDLYQRASAKIEGETDYLNVRADNSSTFTGKNMTATNAEVTADLNCDVYVQVLENLSISATGNSEVYIYESPKIDLKSFSDLAKLHKKELNKN